MADKKILSKDLSHQSLKAICRLKPTLEDVGAFFDVSTKTIQRRCEEYEGLTFVQFRDKYMAETRLKLVRKAINMAENGNLGALIFCLKNINKWQDKIDVEVDNKITHSFTDWARQQSEQLEAAEKQEAIDVTPENDTGE